MYVIVAKDTEKLLDIFMFSSEESAEEYAKTHFFKGVYKIWELASYDRYMNK